MVKAIRIHKTGGPEVLQLEDITLPAPGPGELLVRNRAIGLNFIDTYFRTGLYPAPHLPFVRATRRPARSCPSGRASPSSSRATAWPMSRRSAPMPRSASSR